MSRWSRDDDREDTRDPEHARQAEARVHEHVDDLPARGLTLPRGEEREHVAVRDREYSLNGSETRAPATVGAFRVVVTEDFDSRQQAQEASRGDWRHLSDQGLVTREALTDRDGARHVVALTREGKALLDAHRPVPAKGRPHPRGHLELPDLRIEYETESGRLEHRDVELETEHYSRGQLAGKAKAGFVRYRASGGSGRGGNSRRGGTPVDPHHLERL